VKILLSTCKKTYIFCFSAVQPLAKMLGALLDDMLCFASTVSHLLLQMLRIFQPGEVSQRRESVGRIDKNNGRGRLLSFNKEVDYGRFPQVAVGAGLGIELVLKSEVCVKPLEQVTDEIVPTAVSLAPLSVRDSLQTGDRCS